VYRGFLWIWLWLCALFKHKKAATPQFCRRRKIRLDLQRHQEIAPLRCGRRKPAWVLDEIIHMAARYSNASCRLLADVFNRRHAADLGPMTVGRTYVSETLVKHQHRIAAERRNWRTRLPALVGLNAVWGMDITGMPTVDGRSNPCVGLLDHGSRAVLSLQAVRDKSSITLLRLLLVAIERHGKPHALRTDNEAIFTSWLFTFGLRWLGIRQQHIRRHCPWQNGRIERFFGTLKCEWRGLVLIDRGQLNLALASFGNWYNHHRPHQSLRGHKGYLTTFKLNLPSLPGKVYRLRTCGQATLAAKW
jgi:putative transposase